MATHSSILAWRTPWTEEPGGLQSMGSPRVRHDWSDLAHMHIDISGVPWWLRRKEFTCQFRRHRSLGQEDLLEKEMATHCSILTWEVPWTEEPGGLQSMGSRLQRVGHDLGPKQQQPRFGYTDGDEDGDREIAHILCLLLLMQVILSKSDLNSSSENENEDHCLLCECCAKI